MESWKRTMWILWFGVLLCSASYTMSVPFLPLFLFELGVSEKDVNWWAGVVHSSAFFVGAIMAPLWGSVADKYGRKKMVLRAGFSLALIYALIGFVHTPWELVVVRLLHGFVGGFVPASMAIVSSVAPKEKMGWSLGMMQAGTMSGGILGPVIGGLLAEWFGMRMSFVAAGTLIFAATSAVLFTVREGRPAEPSKRSSVRADLANVFRQKALLSMLLLLVAFQMTYNMIQPLLTLHIADLQGSVEDAALTSGFVFALIGIAGIVASPFWGRTGERLGYPKVLTVCFAGSAVAIASQFFITELWLFTLIQFCFGLFMAGIVPSVNTLMVRSTPDDFRGRSFGLTASANQSGSMIGPLLGGGLGAFLSFQWIFVTAGLLYAALGAIVWFSSGKGGREDAVPMKIERRSM
ncbi:multidrug efflux MFS transporter [Paenibacillus antri]|uniref:Multidrug efflux MFS transporter n=1 Tax=Paenibacillus antri TaxID=2582848 RepID=A0A5R9GDZ8_9BACL|nr:MFS transporter [Paenibacillus antri]TLS52566.1 multidrug efflux MFS transporter [Paenibacillus antri]